METRLMETRLMETRLMETRLMETLPDNILALDKEAIVHWYPCGKGKIPIRQWPNAGAEKLVLLHGGSGSWLHWARNIPALHKHFDVYAIDLPGLGDAAMCEVESDADSASWATRVALEQLFDSRFHLAAFSWGCTITAMMLKDMAPQLNGNVVYSFISSSSTGSGFAPRLLKTSDILSSTVRFHVLITY